jgi:hypothetical protein
MEPLAATTIFVRTRSLARGSRGTYTWPSLSLRPNLHRHGKFRHGEREC